MKTFFLLLLLIYSENPAGVSQSCHRCIKEIQDYSSSSDWGFSIPELHKLPENLRAVRCCWSSWRLRVTRVCLCVISELPHEVTHCPQNKATTAAEGRAAGKSRVMLPRCRSGRALMIHANVAMLCGKYASLWPAPNSNSLLKEAGAYRQWKEEIVITRQPEKAFAFWVGLSAGRMQRPGWRFTGSTATWSEGLKSESSLIILQLISDQWTDLMQWFHQTPAGSTSDVLRWCRVLPPAGLLPLSVLQMSLERIRCFSSLTLLPCFTFLQLSADRYPKLDPVCSWNFVCLLFLLYSKQRK